MKVKIALLKNKGRRQTDRDKQENPELIEQNLIGLYAFSRKKTVL